jgi:hypothetical protein
MNFFVAVLPVSSPPFFPFLLLSSCTHKGGVGGEIVRGCVEKARRAGALLGGGVEDEGDVEDGEKEETKSIRGLMHKTGQVPQWKRNVCLPRVVTLMIRLNVQVVRRSAWYCVDVLLRWFVYRDMFLPCSSKANAMPTSRAEPATVYSWHIIH